MKVTLDVPEVWTFKVSPRNNSDRKLYLKFSEGIDSSFFKECVRIELARKCQKLIRERGAEYPDKSTVDVLDVWVRRTRRSASIEDTLNALVQSPEGIERLRALLASVETEAEAEVEEEDKE